MQAKQSTNPEDCPWTDLSSFQEPRCSIDVMSTGSAIAINDTEFILSRVERSTPGEISILKYNSITGKKIQLCQCHCPSGVEVDEIKKILCASDSSTNKLLVIVGGRNVNYRNRHLIRFFDLSTNQLATVDKYCRFKADHKMLQASSHAIFVNGLCHLFVQYQPDDLNYLDYWRNNSVSILLRHLILNVHSGRLTEVSSIEMGSIRRAIYPFFVSKCRCILLIQRQAMGKNGAIWRFRLDQKQWTKVNEVSIPFWFASAVLSFDENNILMAGWNEMFVLDISDENNYKLNKLSIRTPVEQDGAWPTIIRMGGGSKIKKLVIGWTRNLFGGDEFEDLALPPKFLLQFISRWILQEELHCVYQYDATNNHVDGVQEDGGHHVISMKQVLASVTNDTSCE